jgi:hypothetical protein
MSEEIPEPKEPTTAEEVHLLPPEKLERRTGDYKRRQAGERK